MAEKSISMEKVFTYVRAILIYMEELFMYMEEVSIYTGAIFAYMEGVFTYVGVAKTSLKVIREVFSIQDIQNQTNNTNIIKL